MSHDFNPNNMTPEEEAAYDAYLQEITDYEQTHCMNVMVSGGSDPWAFTCDLPKGHPHSQKHRMLDPMGPDTPALEW